MHSLGKPKVAGSIPDTQIHFGAASGRLYPNQNSDFTQSFCIVKRITPVVSCFTDLLSRTPEFV